MLATLLIPAVGGGGGALEPRLLTTISDVLFGFKRRLLSAAQPATWSSFFWMVMLLFPGTSRYMSSAYFSNLFSWLTGWRSDAVTMKPAGPTADPCTTLALMTELDDVSPSNLVICFLSWK